MGPEQGYEKAESELGVAKLGHLEAEAGARYEYVSLLRLRPSP